MILISSKLVSDFIEGVYGKVWHEKINRSPFLTNPVHYLTHRLAFSLIWFEYIITKEKHSYPSLMAVLLPFKSYLLYYKAIELQKILSAFEYSIKN